MYKFVFINRLVVSNKTPAFRTESDYERKSIERLEQIVDFAVKEKARLIFTSNWLGSVSDKGAFKIAALLSRVSHSAAITDALMNKSAQEALDVIEIKSADATEDDKGPMITHDDGAISIKTGQLAETVLISELPNATGTTAEPYAQVGLLAIGKQRGRSAKNVCKFDVVTIGDDSSFVKSTEPDDAKRSSFINVQGESEFVSRLKENLNDRQKTQGNLPEKLNEALKRKGLDNNEGLQSYVESLFESVD